MKKRNTVALCVAVLALLSGCASTKNAPPPVNYDIHEIERTPVTVFTDDNTLFPAAARAYSAANEDIQLTLKTAGEDAAQEARTLLLSGETPDVIYLSAGADKGLYRALAADEALYDLSPLFSGEQAPALYEGFLDGPAVRAYGDEKITGAPIGFDCAGLLVKSKHFSGDERTLPKTLDDFLLLGQREPSLKLLGFPEDYPAYLEPFALPLIASAGGAARLNTGDFAPDVFRQEAMTKLAQSLSALSSLLYKADPYADTKAVYTAFANDEVLFIPGDASTIELLRGEYGVSDAVLLTPTPAMGERQTLLTSVTPAYIPASAAHPQQGLDYLALLYWPEVYGSAGGVIPPVQGSAESQSGFRKAAASLFESGVTAYCGAFAQEENEDELFQKVYVSLGELVSGRLSPEDWTKAMTQQLAQRQETPQASA